MINQATVMLYVSNVEKSTDFWQQGFNVSSLETIQLPDNYLSVKLFLQHGFALQLFDKEFIQKYSPEVAMNTPSILFSTTDFDSLHNQLNQISPFVSDISEQAGKKHFTFSDYDEHYFAVTEEKTR
ncbi:MAG: VOC family protein [Vagococcus sp.]|jgi:lactoylglutathione lyase|nr:VOC family protein [Vagococcus sp.]